MYIKHLEQDLAQSTRYVMSIRNNYESICNLGCFLRKKLHISICNHFLKIYLFIWLHQVLVATNKTFVASCRIFHYGTWTL